MCPNTLARFGRARGPPATTREHDARAEAATLGSFATCRLLLQPPRMPCHPIQGFLLEAISNLKSAVNLRNLSQENACARSFNSRQCSSASMTAEWRFVAFSVCSLRARRCTWNAIPPQPTGPNLPTFFVITSLQAQKRPTLFLSMPLCAAQQRCATPRHCA